MMLNSLKHLYKEHMITVIEETTEPNNYQWFSDKIGNYFGIKKGCISEKEQKLLELFFQTIVPPIHSLSQREKFWQGILFNNSLELKHQIANKFQFIYFHIKHQEFETNSFSELMRELFETEISILWRDQQGGIIINEGENQTSYPEIIDTITTELFVDFSLFIGTDLDDLADSRKILQIETDLFMSARKSFPKQKLYTVEKVLPVILTNQLNPDLRNYFSHTLLKDIKDDPELFHTIKVYLESNMNLSHAAKKLFIHRNSLQYRVDKFIEKTGIDVKQFENAVSIYISLLF